MRIWLRDAGRLGFVPRIRDDAQEVVTVTVIDLDSVPERELGTVDIAVGGDPVTFQTSVPFQIAVPRIVTFDPVAWRSFSDAGRLSSWWLSPGSPSNN